MKCLLPGRRSGRKKHIFETWPLSSVFCSFSSVVGMGISTWMHGISRVYSLWRLTFYAKWMDGQSRSLRAENPSRINETTMNYYYYCIRCRKTWWIWKNAGRIQIQKSPLYDGECNRSCIVAKRPALYSITKMAILLLCDAGNWSCFSCRFKILNAAAVVIYCAISFCKFSGRPRMEYKKN